jgi:hypothetical protein
MGFKCHRSLYILLHTRSSLPCIALVNTAIARILSNAQTTREVWGRLIRFSVLHYGYTTLPANITVHVQLMRTQHKRTYHTELLIPWVEA